jgi:hypothetical protein
VHDVQAQQPPPPPAAGGENDLYSYRRGDIPIFNFDEADRILIATLQELIEVRLSLFFLMHCKKRLAKFPLTFFTVCTPVFSMCLLPRFCPVGRKSRSPGENSGLAFRRL